MNNNTIPLKNKVFVTTAMVGAFLGYGRNAYAACVNSGGTTYLCSGANAVTQTINANSSSVSTTAGFGVNTNAGNAISISGNGAISFTDSNASIISTSANNSGLNLLATGNNGGDAGSVTIDTNGAISGVSRGINARNNGSGSLAIIANGDVTGNRGIYALNYGANLSITTGINSSINGGARGIYAFNDGTGLLAITANGDVIGASGYGIHANNYGTDLSITTGVDTAVSGINRGIEVSHKGSGSLAIAVNGDVTGANQHGIFARNNNGLDISITTGVSSSIAGGNRGIDVRNDGTGVLDITANGDVTGTSQNGIYAGNDGTDLNITTGAGSTISGGYRGIYASNNGSGVLDITANGDVTGTSQHGINAKNYGTDLSITTGVSSTISGGNHGISAFNVGSGSLGITANGDITGASQYGIYARNSYSSQDLSITSGTGSTISGGTRGISVRNDGSGVLDITANGDVTGTNSEGIVALNFSGTDLNIITDTSSTISGGTKGMSVANAGSGSLSIIANGDVTGTIQDGIYANNYGTDFSITTDAGSTISGGGRGIAVRNLGSGSLDITTNGDVTGTAQDGINAKNYGTDLSIITGSSISGGYQGIVASNQGSGSLDITANGDVTGTTSDGIYAQNHGDAFTITTGANAAITGSNIGMKVDNHGSGDLNITLGSNSSVSSADDDGAGIKLFTGSSNHNATITLDSTSEITTTGDNSSGILVSSNTENANLILNGGTITASGAGSDGIRVFAQDAYYYAYTQTTYSYQISNTLTLNNGISVTGDKAIHANTDSQLDVTLDGTAAEVTLVGTGGTAIQLGDLVDSLRITGDVSIDGDVVAGAGNDTLTLDEADITLTSGSVFTGFENIALNGLSLVDGDFSAVGSNITTTGGDLHVNGSFTATSLTVGNGVELGGNNTINSDLVVASGGTIAPGNSVGTINVVGNVTFNTGSIFEVEVDVGGADRLNATGDIIIQSGVTLELIPLGSFAGSSVTFLDAGGTLTGTFDTVNTNGMAATLVYAADNASLNFSVLTASPVATNTQALASLESGAIFADTLTSAISQSAFERNDNYWIQGIYRGTSRETEGNFTGFDNSVYGVAVGANYVKNDNWKLGFSIADLHNNSDIDNGIGDTDGNGAFVAVYSTYSQSVSNWNMFTTLGLMGGYHDYDTSRRVSNSGIVSDAKGESQSYEAGALLELGVRTKIADDWYVSPKVGLNYIHVFAEGYDETSGGAAAVSIDDYDFGTLRPSAGVSFYNNSGIEIPTTEMKVRHNVNLGVFHEYALTNRDIDGRFSTGTGFNMELDESDNTFGTIGLGADIDLTDGVVGFVNYQHSQSSDEARNDGRVGVKIEF